MQIKMRKNQGDSWGDGKQTVAQVADHCIATMHQVILSLESQTRGQQASLGETTVEVKSSRSQQVKTGGRDRGKGAGCV